MSQPNQSVEWVLVEAGAACGDPAVDARGAIAAGRQGADLQRAWASASTRLHEQAQASVPADSTCCRRMVPRCCCVTAAQMVWARSNKLVSCASAIAGRWCGCRQLVSTACCHPELQLLVSCTQRRRLRSIFRAQRSGCDGAGINSYRAAANTLRSLPCRSNFCGLFRTACSAAPNLQAGQNFAGSTLLPAIALF